MVIPKIINKIKARIWFKIVRNARNTIVYPFLYQSYWHSIFFKGNGNKLNAQYFGARPNPGAGIGHQMANWIAGYWWAKHFGLNFVHYSFSNHHWDNLLGFGRGELAVTELINKGYCVKLLPLFEETDPLEVERIKRIILSYKGKKIVFLAEQDQGYKAQFGVMNDIKHKFYSSPIRLNDNIFFSKEHLNIAIHVRRGDIVQSDRGKKSQLMFRWQDTEYFAKVLQRVLENIGNTKPVAVYLFSQGNQNDFNEFNLIKNISFCLDLDVYNTFIHMVFADILITSKSSFSYKPALLNKGIKICPANFWHDYPKSDDWILVNDDGDFNIEQFKRVQNNQ